MISIENFAIRTEKGKTAPDAAFPSILTYLTKYQTLCEPGFHASRSCGA